MATGSVRGTALGWTVVGPACLCTVAWVWDVAAVAGLVAAVTWAHYAGLAAAPLIAAAIVLRHRRAPRTVAVGLAAAGLVLLLVHSALHLAGHADRPSTAFDVTNRLGIVLLTAAVLADLWAARRRTAVAMSPR